MNILRRKKDASDLWNIIGSFGRVTGEITEDKDAFLFENNVISVSSMITEYENGVRVRDGKIKNISNETVTINTLSSKFSLDGGEYEVYSQYNGWENESNGGWQKLITGTVIRSEALRNAHSATPFAVLWSEQANRGTAFHINTYSNWEIRISKVYAPGIPALIEVEMGMLADGLCLTLEPGDELILPQIIYYYVINKTDMDCWKLHSYLNKKYPRRELPVVYNTWLYKFDRFTYEDILTQIEKAAQIGAEYFVVDAGWFGKGEDWCDARGDWGENLTFGFRGKMKDAANEVRRHGMKFGFWLEPECASDMSDIFKKHPEFFIKGGSYNFLDFSNNDALSYIYDLTCKLIDRYDAKFIKFDFNGNLMYDTHRSGFTKYFEGQLRYINMLKEKYPDLYLENCGSGGMRMTMRDGMVFDSFWLSDNQCPYHSLRIFKDTLLRMPPQWIECWATVASVPKLAPIYNSNEFANKLIATGDGVWGDVRGVSQSFLNGLLTGGPIGMSFDLTSLTDEAFDSLKSHIDTFKNNRSFWKNALCRILSDTDSVLALQFYSEDFSKAELVVFAKEAFQSNICVFPIMNPDFTYRLSDNSQKSGKELFENGIDFPVKERSSAQFMTIEKI